MGRELIVGIYDMMGNEFSLDENDDWYICGRTEFTNELSSIFYGRSTEFLVLDIYGEHKDGESVAEGCRDVGNDQCSPEEGRMPVYVPERLVTDVISQDLANSEKKLKRNAARMESLSRAMGHASNLSDWLDMDEYMSILCESEEELSNPASRLFLKYINEAKKACIRRDGNLLFNRPEASEIGLNLEMKETHRYFPVIALSE